MGPYVCFFHDFILDVKKQFQRKPTITTTVSFQEFPLTLQYRFYQLQTPVNQMNLLKANPAKWLLKAINGRIVVDSFQMDLKASNKYGRLGTKMLSMEPDWTVDGDFVSQAFCEPLDHLFLRILKAGKLKNRISQIQKIIPRKHAFFDSLDQNQLPKIIKNCNLSNISRLEIIHSFLNEIVLRFIKNLRNLDYIRLHLKNNKTAKNQNFIKRLLQCISGIPNVRVYFNTIYIGDYMEKLLVDWILEFGYIKSLDITFLNPPNLNINVHGRNPKHISFATEEGLFFEQRED